MNTLNGHPLGIFLAYGVYFNCKMSEGREGISASMGQLTKKATQSRNPLALCLTAQRFYNVYPKLVEELVDIAADAKLGDIDIAKEKLRKEPRCTPSNYVVPSCGAWQSSS